MSRASEIVADFRALPDEQREAIEKAAHLVLVHTHAVGGIGQTGEEQRRAQAAVEALPDAVRLLAEEAVPAWRAAVSDLWLSATAEGLDPDANDLDVVLGDDDEMLDLQRLVLVSSRWFRVAIAMDLHEALLEEGE